jgi:hypothetical protein
MTDSYLLRAKAGRGIGVLRDEAGNAYRVMTGL